MPGEPKKWIEFLATVFPGVHHSVIASLLHTAMHEENLCFCEMSAFDQPLPDARKLFPKAGEE